jgi:hypothetical protein
MQNFSRISTGAVLWLSPIKTISISIRIRHRGHSAAEPQPNPKHETRNSKQIQMTKIRMIQKSSKGRQEICPTTFQEIKR